MGICLFGGADRGELVCFYLNKCNKLFIMSLGEGVVN